MSEFTFETSDDLEECVAYWQNELSISEWKIGCTISRAKALNAGNKAEIEFTRANRTALLRVLDPIDYSNSVFPLDHEVDVVHELLHLKFASFMSDEPGSDVWIDQEWTIESTARLLVKLNRKGKEALGGAD